jgi:dTDP-4-amino-4,6-dideoxygalactose transaminase
MKIPLVDLRAQYLAHQAEIDSAISRVIGETAFIGGSFVKDFESAYARECGVKHCISVANGTDAIYIALKMLGMGPGDEVITTAHSWISTSETISQTGATPVFVDVDEFYTIDADRIEAAITARTRMILPVHLYGQPSDMARIMRIADKHGLLVLEDCAQAHFATFEGQRVGTFGNAATFSFYPGKNLGAYGDAGAIVTNDDELASKMRMYANHGALKKHTHLIEGVNSRLDGMQAAILSAKLPHIHEWTERRRRVAALYDDALAAALPQSALPKVRQGASHVYHLYVVQVERRDDLAAFLAARGVQTAVHYPVALPLMPAYAYLGGAAARFPRAASNQDRILSLPIFPELTADGVEYISAAIAAFASSERGAPGRTREERML